MELLTHLIPTGATALEQPAVGQHTLLVVPTTETHREWFKAVARNEEYALRQIAALGRFPTALDVPFESFFVGEAPATLTRGGNDEIVYWDGGLNQNVRYQPLPQLRASLVSGIPFRLPPRMYTEWRMRLLVEAELVAPAAVELPPVPGDAAMPIKLAHAGLLLLFRCRWALEYGRPLPYTERFASTWCGLRRRDAKVAVAALRRWGVIRKVDEAPSANPRWIATHLFLPGELLNE